MPTYEFRCPNGHEFEKLYRTISGAEAQAACPECGVPAERVMSAAGFSFKGSGFYLTDYGKNAHRDKGTPEPKSGAPAGDGGDASTAKVEAKGDAPAPAAATGSPSAEPKKQPEPKAEPKPAAAPAKKSSSE
jgi:putative FmdB family regulatory protein